MVGPFDFVLCPVCGHHIAGALSVFGGRAFVVQTEHEYVVGTCDRPESDRLLDRLDYLRGYRARTRDLLARARLRFETAAL